MLARPEPKSRTKAVLQTVVPADWIALIANGRFLYRQRFRDLSVPSMPHFDAAGTKCFTARMGHSRHYLEYGSGGSTLIASRFVQTLVSVDSDRYFLRSVEEALSDRPAALAFIHADIGLTEPWGYPIFRRRTPQRRRRWMRYVTSPWAWFAEHELEPDTILVDGRFRVACVLESVLRLKSPASTEILFDDYPTRPFYAAVEEFCDLAELNGKMAVLRPKEHLDQAALRRRLDEFYTDWR